MNAERHHRVMQVLAEVIESDASGREELLAEFCAGDGLLRAEIERLMKHQEQAADFLEESLLEMAERRFGIEPSIIGKEIGAYRVTELIGHGGTGAVYRAVRDDDEFHREVAIKVIRLGVDSSLILRHFRNERQILANLDHQNIARLFDGGTTVDGIPYIIMEYVDGQPLHEFANTHRLSITDRLKLFLSVCEAVEYAHRHQVVHRDLKPGNILVTREGIPKLLDFGIAKLLNPHPTDITNESTLGMLRMTPEYASPEQMRGLPITSASDIYSLGVILFELLTGLRPYSLWRASPYEIAQVVCEVEPEKPSRIVARNGDIGHLPPAHIRLSQSLVRTRRRLAGDLDTIVLKALRKEPQRRYESVAQLSDDIRRHLDGRPIKARKDTIAYRSVKFMNRNKTGVLTTLTVAVLCLLVGIAVTLISMPSKVANLSIKSESPDAVTNGNALTYRFTISNSGPDNATDVVFTNTISGSVTLHSVTSSPGAACTGTTTITCNLGAINNQATANLQIIVIPNSSGMITNRASAVSGTKSDPISSTVNTLVKPRVCTPVPAGSVGWWPGDGNANDASNNGNKGKLKGGVTFLTGKVNQAFNFATIDQIVYLDNSPGLRLQDFTIDAWVKYESQNFSSDIFDFVNGGYELAIFGAVIPGGSVAGGAQRVGGLYLSKHGINHVHSGGLTVPADGLYHHIAVTKSGPTVIFYVDGVASAPVSYREAFVFTTFPSIGGNLVGSVDEVEIFNRGLDPSEIAAIYDSGSAGRCRN